MVVVSLTVVLIAILLPVKSEQCTNTLLKFEVLPGAAFDNLRNVDMGRVMAISYDECRTSEDGKFLIPDGVRLTPIKRSNVKTSADIFEHFSDYKSSTAFSINAEMSALSMISGSFSTEFQTVKKHQVNDKAVTTRVELRHDLYTAMIQPDSKLEPAFRKRLVGVANTILSNKTEEARYLSELIIRDYGTHVVTSIEAGASLLHLEHLQSSFVSDHSSEVLKIKTQASANFLGLVKFSLGMSYTTDKSFAEKYQNSVTSSETISYGGPLLKAHFDVDNWEDSVFNELVAIDRSGDPIYYTITAGALPEIPEPVVRQVSEMVKASSDRYYKVNTVRGCMNIASPNFNFQANVEDGSCQARGTNFTFGGVYTTCAMRLGNTGNYCAEIAQINPVAGAYGCRPGYTTVEFIKGTVQRMLPRNECPCHHCGFLGWGWCCDCRTVYHANYADYEAYWCVATGHVQQESGLLFGGLYTSTSSNPVTKQSACPDHFLPLRLGKEMKICVSDDYELGYRYSLPFAGFFNCKVGNPLSTPQTTPGRSQAASNDRRLLLATYVDSAGQTNWLHRCPPGYAQHLATVENNCEAMYCIKANSFADYGFLGIRRPPFSDAPPMNAGAADTMNVIGPAQEAWTRSNVTEHWALESGSGNASPKQTLNGGMIALVTIMSTAILGLLVAVVILSLKFRNRQRGAYQGLIGDNDTRQQLYGSTANEDEIANELALEINSASS